ncbi:hypothetical protein PHJA_003026300 [Phtheirospermum japonicum]|uniref:RIN4 pathogenic type III effector avirulence factor Avr cleavage site domain-containing protein n=1 Tax=Phtheirospermum japonicum TaxID=374723 RepID=A0A830DDS3_9LAMI|nr:hypothetical protein PHJA_003026300 [Phtheirospermum japonicum]
MTGRENAALPKFGSWDVNNPAAAGQYSVIFDRARDEKRAGQAPMGRRDSPRSDMMPLNKQDAHLMKLSNSKRWLCCSNFKYAES